MIKILSAVIFGLAFIVSSSSFEPRPDEYALRDLAGAHGMSPSALSYVLAAFEILEQKIVTDRQVNWESLRRESLRWARGAKTPKDTYPAIRYFIDQLGQPHTYFLEEIPETDPKEMTSPEYSVSGGILEIQVPAFGNSPATQLGYRNFRSEFHRFLLAKNFEELCGVVVDLRSNDGGDMWGMLGLLFPFLREGTLGFFFDGKSSVPWIKSGKEIYSGSKLMVSLADPVSVVKRFELPVALLISPKTASAGEAVAVALVDEKNENLFGDSSAGFITGNEAVRLRDGAALVVSSVYYQNRFGMVYKGPLLPLKENRVLGDRAHSKARAYLQEACQN